MSTSYLWKWLGVFGVLAWGATELGAQPRLQITELGGGQFEVRWTNQPPDFVLETSPSLSPPAPWTAAAEVPTARGDLLTVTFSPAEAARFFRLRRMGLTVVAETSPTTGEAGVSVTRETILRFSNPLAADVQLTTDRFFADFGGRRLLTRVELSADRASATLFYLEPLPGAARIQATLVSDGLQDAAGRGVDGDGDGQPGGARVLSFVTAANAELPGTRVIGRVFASEPVPLAGGGFTNRPLAGVTLTVDGAEELLRTQTDENGFFSLRSPAGRFFVHVDGRTAWDSQWPNGDYYPYVGKTFEAMPGVTNNLAGGTGEIFLPRVKAGTLRAVSATEPTTVTFPPAVLAEHPELAGVSLTVPPNALYDDSGTRGGRVGIAPVEPDRIPSPLPPGLDLPLVITIQTDGPSNFSAPVPVRFPNLPDPVTGQKLPPGAKSALWSYNHDTGRWDIQGSMTVTADGNFVETDPGVGVRQPGWHGSTPGSTGGGGGAGGPGPCQAEQQDLQDALFGCAFGAAVELAELAPAIGCGISLGMAAASAYSDCSDPTKSCAGSLAYNGLFGVAGCVPGVGLYAGALQCSIELGSALGDLAACQSTTRRALQSAGHARPASPRLLDDDDQALQDQLLNAARDLVVSIYGGPEWMEAAAADPERTTGFGRALVAALDPVSEAAARISPAERDALLALPAPNGLPATTVTALLDRFDRFALGEMTAAEKTAIETAATALQVTATAAQAAGWETMLDGVLELLAEITRVHDEGLRGAAGGAGAATAAAHPSPHLPGGYGPVRSRELLYHQVDLRTGFVRRGRTSPNGQLDSLITGVDTPYFLTYLDPETLEAGTTHFRSGAAGERYRLPLGLLTHMSGPDADGDGLNDFLEQIVGTRADAADTDNDGASDLEEVRQGLNPLDGLALPQGVVANLPLGGSTTGFSNDARALGLCVDDARVFVANGKRGLAIVDAADPLRPLWLGELDLPGESFDISLAPDHRVVGLVASPEQFVGGERGLLHLVDVADPRNPRLKLSYSLPAASLDHWNGRFYVALGQFALKEVRIYDAASALEIGRFALQDYATGIRVVGGRAYVATVSGLEIFDARPGALNRLGRLAGDFTPELLGRAHLVLDGNTLYVGKTRGVATVDVSDPAAPRFLGVPPATTGAVRSLALNGGGRMLALVSGTPTGNAGIASSFSVYDASDPSNTTAFLFGLFTPGRARDVALVRGFAVVADDTRGLTIANFADPDLARQAPAITFDPASVDVNPAQPGVQVEFGTDLELLPRIVDDVQFDRAELLVDGVVVDSTRTFPVNLRVRLGIETNLVVPPGGPFVRAKSARTVVLKGRVAPADTWGCTNLFQFRAFDRSGNVRLSDPLPVEVLGDATPSVLARSLPAPGQAAFLGQPFVLEFNEPVDALPPDLTLARLVNLGPDAAPGGGDDTVVPSGSATAFGPVVNLGWTITNLAVGRYQLTLEPGFVQDRAGNALAQAHVLTFDVVDAHPGSAVWISDADGNWDNPANWLHGRLPSQDDHVLLQRFGAKPKITLNTSAIVKGLRAATPLASVRRAGLTVLQDLSAAEPVEIPDGNFIVSGSAFFEQALTINGGALSVSGRLETRATLTLETGGELTLSGPGAQFVPTGGIQGANFRFIARDGAVIELPGFAHYDGPGDFTLLFPVGTSFRAQGAGSRLTLGQMTSASGPVNWNVRGVPALQFEAVSGGRLELPSLTTLNNRVKLLATGDGSVLAAPVLASVIGTEAPFAAAIEAGNNGRVQVPALTTRQNCPITETDGGVVERP